MGKKHFGTGLFSVLLGSLFFVGLIEPATATPPDSEKKTAALLAAEMNASLGLRASQVANLKLGAIQPHKLAVSVPLGDLPATLELELHSVRSPDYRVEIDFGGGVMGEVPAGPVKTYRGSLRDVPGSIVAAHEDDEGLHAKIVLPDGNRFWIEPVAGRVAGADAGLHVVYHNDDVFPSGASCAAGDDMRVQKEEILGSVAGMACGTGLCVAEIAADADVEFYQRYGSVSGVENRINAIINGVNVEYERDVAIRHVISHIIIRIAEPDPYTSTNPQTLLGEFRNHWSANHSSVPRDTAELFTGKNIDGNVIGIAWVGAICGSSAYSVVQADCCGSLACATDLSAHELGHNWNAGHCTCSGTTMNPSLTCTNVFHPSLTVPVITSFRDSRSCLSGATGGCTTNAQCDDGNPCTTDLCSTGTCFNTNNNLPCDDGLWCNGTDTCSGGSCSNHTGNPCPPPDGDAYCSESCNEALDNCSAPDPNGSPCDDGLWCNGSDSCQNGSCIIHAGSPCPGPDGDNDCRESCNESARTCTASDLNNSPCNDGNPATTNDVCTGGVCTGTPININCDDGNPCTIDTISGSNCVYSSAPIGTPCNDGLFCNGPDTCNGGTCSLHSGNPCPGPDGDANCRESCDEATDTCTANDANGAACDDGNASTINDRCSAGVCAGTPISCDDNNPCTTDIIVGTTCTHTPVAYLTPCDDGLYCNGTDACNAGACTIHSGNPCLSGPTCANVCNEDANNCFAPMGAACTPDNNPCTSDVCNGSGSCVHPFRLPGSPCNDNLWCNGIDTCNGSGLCVHSGNPCPGPDGDLNCAESCDEGTDGCTANDPNGTSCGDGNTCLNGLCIANTYCGDGWCDESESCRRCPQDCGFPQGFACESDSDCCSGRCRNGKCLRSSLTIDR